jgi:quercetin dioxygenase-like cupin family protein
METFEQFNAITMAEGFDEVLTREWEANHETAVHEHPFEAFGRIVRGEFWLTIDGKSTLLKQGDTFRVARHKPHQEKYGPDGASLWIARMNQLK